MDAKEVGNTVPRTVSSSQVSPVVAVKMLISTSFLNSAQAELFSSHQLEEVEVVRLKAQESAEAEVTLEERFTKLAHHSKNNPSCMQAIVSATRIPLIWFPPTRRTKQLTIHSSWRQSTHSENMGNTRKKREFASSAAARDHQLSSAVGSSRAIYGSVAISVLVGTTQFACETNSETWASWTIF